MKTGANNMTTDHLPSSHRARRAIHGLAGVALLVTGLILVRGGGPDTSPDDMPVEAAPSIFSVPIPVEKGTEYHPGPGCGYLVDRVRREAEASAAVAVWQLHADITSCGDALAEKLMSEFHSFGKVAGASFRQEDAFRKKVADMVMEELNRSNRLEIAINRMIDQFMYDLDLHEEWAIQRIPGAERPPAYIRQQRDSDEFFRDVARSALRDFGSGVLQENRKSAKIGGAFVAVDAAGFFLGPFAGIAVTAASLAGDAYVSSSRDVEGGTMIGLDNGLETLADQLCFGGESYPGLYRGLLMLAEVRMRLLETAIAPACEDGRMDTVDWKDYLPVCPEGT